VLDIDFTYLQLQDKGNQTTRREEWEKTSANSFDLDASRNGRRQPTDSAESLGISSTMKKRLRRSRRKKPKGQKHCYGNINGEITRRKKCVGLNKGGRNRGGEGGTPLSEGRLVVSHRLKKRGLGD